MRENYKAVVLLSGGVDSTTCLSLAVNKYGAEDVLALSVFYGQKHFKELTSAQSVAIHYKVDMMEQDLSNIFEFSNCSLLIGSAQQIPHTAYSDQLKQAKIVNTYVPFRNGLMLSASAAIAISVNAEVLYYGAHQDDAVAAAYPDCTPEFVEGMSNAIYQGSGQQCKLEAPLLYMTKAEVVELGLKNNAPYELTWSCYEGGIEPCGTCGTCIDRANAFELNGTTDPAIRYKGGK